MMKTMKLRLGTPLGQLLEEQKDLEAESKRYL